MKPKLTERSECKFMAEFDTWQFLKCAKYWMQPLAQKLSSIQFADAGD